MRGLLWVLLATAAALGLAVARADEAASWFLSRRYGADVRVEGTGIGGWGVFSAASFSVSAADGGEEWFRGGPAHVRFPSFPSTDSVFVDLKNLEPAGGAREKIRSYASWLKSPDAMPESSLDRVLIAAVRREGEWSVRILEASSEHFSATGGARFKAGRLSKADVRWSVSEFLFSRWPEGVYRKMMPGPDGWRAAGLAFGGTTWTLRGSGGPVLQFSATAK